MSKVTYTMIDPPQRGVPAPRYFKPLMRVNGVVQDAGINYVIQPCFLPTVPTTALARTAPGDSALSAQDDVFISLNTAAATCTLPANTTVPINKVFIVVNHGTNALALSLPVKISAAGTVTSLPAGSSLQFINTGTDYRKIG